MCFLKKEWRGIYEYLRIFLSKWNHRQIAEVRRKRIFAHENFATQKCSVYMSYFHRKYDILRSKYARAYLKHRGKRMENYMIALWREVWGELKTMICVNHCLNTTRYRGCKSWKYNIGRSENVKILCQISLKIV